MLDKLIPQHSVRASVALLLVRLYVGTLLVTHGWGKIQNPFHWMGADASTPAFFQLLAAVSEFGGGAALVLGLLTPLACFGIACTMAVAVYTHLTHGGSWELAGIYLCVALGVGVAGPGTFSVDAKWLVRR